MSLLFGVLLSTIACFPSDGMTEEQEAPSVAPAIPIHGPQSFVVKYLGITCGHMTLESHLESFDGRPAYHIVMTARNSKFFNRIYKVDARIESWLDAETLSSLVYLSESTEKGETSRKRYEVNRKDHTVLADEDGVLETIEYTSEEPVLDPMAYVFRLRALADQPDEVIAATLLTSKGAVKTIARVSPYRERKTVKGKRQLLQVTPETEDGVMFSRKGEFSLWIDPNDNGALYTLDFDLPFGHLIAKRR